MKEEEKSLGVTFAGSVTFNGPMFDIHDNQKVTIVNAKTEKEENIPELTLGEHEKSILNKLTPMFYGLEGEARDFLLKIKGMKPTQVTALVNKLVSDGKISELSRKRDLWKVLHDTGLYKPTDTNWYQQVK